MLDTSLTSERCGRYNNGKITVHRPCRLLHADASAILRDTRISGGAALLHLWMLDQPVNFRFVVKNIVSIRNADGSPRYGGRNRVLVYLRELRAAGYIAVDVDGRDGGGIETGIYVASSRPRLEWMDCAIDADADEFENVPEIGASQTREGEARSGSLRKYNSIEENYTDTGGESVENAVPSCQQPNAEARQGGPNGCFTGKSEPRDEAMLADRDHRSAARHLPQNEREPARAKGSAGQRGGTSRAKKSSGMPGEIRNIERTCEALAAAGGRALADIRTTPGLWRLAEVIAWLTCGYDLHLDVLPTVREVSTRAVVQPGQVRSWRYYSAAIRDAHARRNGLEVPRTPPRFAPRLDPYAPAPRDPNDGRTWQSVGLAAFLPSGRSR